MLRVEELRVAYGKIVALDGVSLGVGERELVAVIGANGAGKSSLLSALMGLVEPRGGAISFRGREITRFPSWERVRLGIALVPEGGRIFPDLSVEQNLRLGGYIIGRGEELSENLELVFSLFPVLKERFGQRAGTLSGGERQMLAIGRALMASPKLLLVDEVSMGLMPKLIPEILGTLVRLREERGMSVLLAEQNAREALQVVDRGYVLKNGRIALEGTAAELRENAEVKAAYLGL
ncbi:branched-chain amino acid ABC transporter ATP-binding protein [Candidatus Acetothermia bacterium]|nr:MAG: branched-chain amino acid ABC transporter ATP-binding protein [Candidatus Acetothermia bacterium]